MQDATAGAANPELRQIVAEASQALARLDAARLEDLALSCQALTRTLNPQEPRVRKLVAEQAGAAQSDMAVFARVLEATRANLNVMNRLRELRAGRVEYTERQIRPGAGPALSTKAGPEIANPVTECAEEQHGNH
ncbi:MAG: hypothetical protein ACRD3S_15465 [Terracidiphilus sp.]